MRIPTKPGETIKEAMEEWVIDIDHLSRLTDLSKLEINNLIRGSMKITKDIAQKLEFAFGVGADFWLAREKNYRKKLRNLANKGNEK